MSAENGEIIMNRGAFEGMDKEQLKRALEFRWEELWYFDLEGHRREAVEVLNGLREKGAERGSRGGREGVCGVCD